MKFATTVKSFRFVGLPKKEKPGGLDRSTTTRGPHQLCIPEIREKYSRGMYQAQIRPY